MAFRKDTSAINFRTTRKNKTLRLEHLEARAMFAIDAFPLEPCEVPFPTLASAGEQAPSPAVLSQNSAPTIVLPVQLVGGSIITGQNANAYVFGADNSGESSLSYRWTTVSTPAGGSITFSKNGNNSAKNTQLSFKAPGDYEIQATVQDSSGLSVTSNLQLSVVATLKELAIQTAKGTKVAAGFAAKDPAPSQQFTVVGLDQFGKAMSDQPSVQWEALSKPAGSLIHLNTNGGTVTATVNQAGAYTLQARSGNVATKFHLNVTQSLSTLNLLTSAGTLIDSDSTISVNQTSERIRVQGLDQFNDVMTQTPRISWAATTKPSGGNASGVNSGDNATITFTRAGDYTLQAAVGNVTANVPFRVNQVLADVSAIDSKKKAIDASKPQTTIGLSHTLTAVALDQFGVDLQQQPAIVWQSLKTPAGGSVTLAQSGNLVDAEFSKAGAYSLKAVTGSKSVTIPLSVGQKLSALSFKTPDGAVVESEVAIESSNTEQQIRVYGTDQFGTSLSVVTGVTWSTQSSPTGGSAKISFNQGVVTVAASRAGQYVIRAKFGSEIQTFTINFSQAFTSIVASWGNKAIKTGTAISIADVSSKVAAVALDQFEQTMAVQPTFAWSQLSAPAGGSTSIVSTSAQAETTFTLAGNYSVQIAAQGKTSRVLFDVKQTLSAVTLRTLAGTAVDVSTPITVNGTSQQVRILGLDQFGNPIKSPPKLSWSTSTRTSGGTAKASITADKATINFTRAGDYTLKATSGKVTASVSFSVHQVLTSVSAVDAKKKTIDPKNTSITNGLSFDVTGIAMDQFGDALTQQPSIAWQTQKVAPGGSATLSQSSNAVTTAFSKAGAYSLTATTGSKSVTIPISVEQSLASLSFAVPNGVPVQTNVAIAATGTSQNVRVSGADQFGDAMPNVSGITWSAQSKPSGATAKVSFQNGVATVSVNRAGTYVMQAKFGNKTLTISLSFGQEFDRVVALDSKSKEIESGKTVTVTGTSDKTTARALDQFGQPLTTQPRIVWSPVSSPAGGSAILTPNTVTFDLAGTYKLRATANNQYVDVIYAVEQKLNRLTLSGNDTVEAGRQRQLGIKGLDQFDQPVSIPSSTSIKWSVTKGSISSKGLLTATSNTGTVRVTAKIGNISGTLDVLVTTQAPQSGLQNSAISQLVTSLYSDSVLSRNEMIQILRIAGTDGQVDATELADLRSLVSSSSTYHIPEYAKELAKDVVNSNPANLTFNGQTAGNLRAGSSSMLLNNLIDKWFLGADEPALTGSGVNYHASTGTLFTSTPALADSRQGIIGDCYFITSLGSIANENPNAVRNMFIDNGDGTYTVRFYAGTLGAFYNNSGLISSGFISGSGVADYVTVNRRLATFANGALAYAGLGLSATSASTTIWMALAEKAYAQWNETGNSGRDGTNRYTAIEGGWMANVNAQILGYNSTTYSFSTPTQQSMIDALNANRAVTLGSKDNAPLLVNSHAYTVTHYDASTGRFTLFNAWGNTHPEPMTWDQLIANCTQFVVVDPTGSTAPVVTSSVISSSLLMSNGSWSVTTISVSYSSNLDGERNENEIEHQTEFDGEIVVDDVKADAFARYQSITDRIFSEIASEHDDESALILQDLADLVDLAMQQYGLDKTLA